MKKEEDDARIERVYDVKILFILTTTYRGNTFEHLSNFLIS